MLNNEGLFNNNIERIVKTIEIINSNNLSRQIRKFCINEMSSYYTDDEFKKAISILQLAEKSHFSYEVFDLLTNKNIPFMEDRNSLIDKALFLINHQFQRMPSNTISEQFEYLTKELNKEGTYNMNMSLIFSGINEETIKSFTGNEPITVKKLIK